MDHDLLAFIVTLLAVSWIVLGAMFGISYGVEMRDPCIKRYKRALLQIISGPLYWLSVGIFYVMDLFDEWVRK